MIEMYFNKLARAIPEAPGVSFRNHRKVLKITDRMAQNGLKLLGKTSLIIPRCLQSQPNLNSYVWTTPSVYFIKL